MVLNDVAEFLAVGRAAARIRIKDDVSFRGHPLKLVIEDEAVRGVRPAVNVENERIFFRCVEDRRLLHPCLDFFAVEALIRNLFRLGQVELREKFVVYVRELFQLTPGVVRDEQVVDARCVRDSADNFRAVA